MHGLGHAQPKDVTPHDYADSANRMLDATRVAVTQASIAVDPLRRWSELHGPGGG